ncbi:MAG: helix-turn-helix transcriptional regulator [Ruminococcus sp.]|nr:helix-turn-helix transcriptional regulator [Ruminococcus sp.]
MDKQLLKSIMLQFGDTQESLAAAMGISLSRFNAKINERGGAAFTQSEMAFMIDRYNMDGELAMRVFFPKKVS